MKTYEKTHHWLRFEMDLRKLDHTIWLLVGEAASKVEHIAGVPLSPEAAKQLHKVYLAKGALATTAIEGNTLTEEEALRFLEGKLELPPSRQYLKQEIDNIVRACNRIGREILREGGRTISPEQIRNYNAWVLDKLPLAEDVEPGALRKHSVTVGRYRAAPAEDCEYLLDRFCRWLNGLALPKGVEKAYSILAAIAAHLYFVWIHPFGDGNGRTARLIEFRFLLQAGFPTPAAHLLSNFYNQTRAEYYRRLDQAGRLEGEMAGFIAYAAQGLVDQLREQISVIRNHQWETTWQNYVYERFGKASAAQHRRRRLVLDLSKQTANRGWVTLSDLPELTPRLAREYAKKTQKTLSRDLNDLIQMGLVQRRGSKVRANKGLILAFLPERALADPESPIPKDNERFE
ncbi:Fic family protein [Candidatus Sumerlaeota bacterium]|nr:Fic family protein [Candidatus Sumerlaeota bacterium]